MKHLYIFFGTLVVCLTGCGGGGGGGATNGDEAAAIIPAECAATEMTFNLGDSDFYELPVEKMSFTESTPGFQAGKVDIKFSLKRFGIDVVNGVELSGDWYTTIQENGEARISVSQTQTTVAGVEVKFEAYHLGVQVLSTEYTPDGLPASREAVFTDGIIQVWVDGKLYKLETKGEKAHIKYLN
ncbi:MAG: hypothetical protein IJA81_11490 [Akkermansia sp.]|nr:hypothetical protein [Akkermansia sp.]